MNIIAGYNAPNHLTLSHHYMTERTLITHKEGDEILVEGRVIFQDSSTIIVEGPFKIEVTDHVNGQEASMNFTGHDDPVKWKTWPF